MWRWFSSFDHMTSCVSFLLHFSCYNVFCSEAYSIWQYVFSCDAHVNCSPRSTIKLSVVGFGMCVGLRIWWWGWLAGHKYVPFFLCLHHIQHSVRSAKCQLYNYQLVVFCSVFFFFLDYWVNAICTPNKARHISFLHLHEMILDWRSFTANNLLPHFFH